MEPIPPLLPKDPAADPHTLTFLSSSCCSCSEAAASSGWFGEREKKGPGRSLFSKGLVEGQRVPYLPPLSRAGMSRCSPSSQLGGGLLGRARGVGALFGQAEQLLGQLLIPHHLPGQTRRKELLKSPSGQQSPAAPGVCSRQAPPPLPSPNQVLILVLSNMSKDSGDFLLLMAVPCQAAGLFPWNIIPLHISLSHSSPGPSASPGHSSATTS